MARNPTATRLTTRFVSVFAFVGARSRLVVLIFRLMLERNTPHTPDDACGDVARRSRMRD